MLFYQLGPAAGMGKLGAAARWAGTRSAAGFPSLCCPFRGWKCQTQPLLWAGGFLWGSSTLGGLCSSSLQGTPDSLGAVVRGSALKVGGAGGEGRLR